MNCTIIKYNRTVGLNVISQESITDVYADILVMIIHKEKKHKLPLSIDFNRNRKTVKHEPLPYIIHYQILLVNIIW